LINQGKTSLLLDMGTGVLSRLYDWLPPEELDALVLTHLHPDHFLDIYPFRYFLEFCAPEKLPLKVLAPAGAVEHIQPLFNESDPANFERVFSFVDLAAGEFTIGDLKLAGHRMPHLEPTYGIELRAEGKRVFYTSDTAFDERLVDLIKGADLLLAESTLLASQAGEPVAHMATSQVGELARRAEVKRLVLTHLWPHFDRQQILAEVKKEFDGPVELADEGLVIEV
jgi:ribonuclease BN (tRNA processing enzyme)